MGISPAKKLDLPAFFLQQMKQMDTWGFHLQSGWIFTDVHSEKPWASSISRGTTPNSHGRYVVMASMSLTPLKILKWKGGQLHMAQWFSDIQLIALLSGYSIFPAPFFSIFSQEFSKIPLVNLSPDHLPTQVCVDNGNCFVCSGPIPGRWRPQISGQCFPIFWSTVQQTKHTLCRHYVDM